jgi:nucleotide-binding universal stress UspA family protein
MSYKKILVAVDSSAHALSTVKAGFEIARLLHADIGLVYVIDRAREAVSADLGITPKQSETVLRKEAHETMAQLIRLNSAAEEVWRFFPEGFPREEILHTAQEWGADMIVMHAHCQPLFERLLTRNTVHYVIAHSHKPVMVVQ